MAHLSKEQIKARKAGRGEAKLPDGTTVGIRALTRDEVLQCGEGAATTAERDNKLIALGMTDPAMTEEEVAEWAATASAGDLVAISEAIGELSGLQEGAGKRRVANARGRRRS